MFSDFVFAENVSLSKGYSPERDNLTGEILCTAEQLMQRLGGLEARSPKKTPSIPLLIDHVLLGTIQAHSCFVSATSDRQVAQSYMADGSILLEISNEAGEAIDVRASILLWLQRNREGLSDLEIANAVEAAEVAKKDSEYVFIGGVLIENIEIIEKE